MEKYFLIITLIFVLLIPGCFNPSEPPQTVTLFGTVIDSETEEAIENSTVRFEDEITTTDENGTFTIENLNPGEYDIVISHLENYQTLNESITIGDEDLYQTFKLEPKEEEKEDEEENNEGETEYNVEIETRTGPGSDFNLYYPENLEGGPFPVITWGNGTGASPISYYELLTNMAGNGFIVVASRSGSTGSGEEMLEGVYWLIEENENSYSDFYGNIDTNNIGATGHSQGGGGTINAGADPIIKTTVPIQPALFGASPRDLQGPTFIIAGGEDSIIPDWYVRYWVYSPTQVPAIYGNLTDANHFTPTGRAEGMAYYIIEWFKAHLKNNQTSQEIFLENKGIFNDNNWSTRTQENNNLF